MFLSQVQVLVPSSHSSSRPPPGILECFPRVRLGEVFEDGLEAWFSVSPWSKVHRFFLAPDQVGGGGETVEFLGNLIPGERGELLDSGDGNVFQAVRVHVFPEGVVDLTGAKDQATNTVGFLSGGQFRWDHLGEARAFAHLCK